MWACEAGAPDVVEVTREVEVTRDVVVPQTVLVEAEVSPVRMEVTRLVEATRVTEVEVTRQIQVEVTREVRVEVTPTPTPTPTPSNFDVWDVLWNDLPTVEPTPAPPPTVNDRKALIALYNATDGTNWSDNTNWLSDAPLDEWFGVSVDSRGLWLDLQDNGLSGEIPGAIGDLTTVRSIDLSQNHLSGEIPPEVNNLSTLWSLDLGVNQLSGDIPLLDNLHELELLALNDNLLTNGISTILEDVSPLSEETLTDSSDSDEDGGTLSHLCNIYPAVCGRVPRGDSVLSKLYLDNNPFDEDCVEPFGRFYRPSRDLDPTDFMNPPICGISNFGITELPGWINLVSHEGVTYWERVAIFAIQQSVDFATDIGMSIPGNRDIEIHMYRNHGEVRIYLPIREGSIRILKLPRDSRWYQSVDFGHSGSDDVTDWFELVVPVVVDYLMAEYQTRPTRWPWWLASGLGDWISLAVIEREASSPWDVQYLNPPFGIQLESVETEMAGCSVSLEILSIKAPARDEVFTDPPCGDFLAVRAVNLLASRVGLREIGRFFSTAEPGVTWNQHFASTFGMTTREFYELFEEYRAAGYPRLLVPMDRPEWR